MTREEEIIEASQLYAKHQQKPFIDGAMWADKHPHVEIYMSEIEKAAEESIDSAWQEHQKHFWNMIENQLKHDFISKAHEWLKENVDEYGCISSLPEDFKKYMEEVL